MRAAFSTIAVDPDDSQHLIAATDMASTSRPTRVSNWTLLDAGVHFDLVVDWGNAAGDEVYVGRQGWACAAGSAPARGRHSGADCRRQADVWPWRWRPATEHALRRHSLWDRTVDFYRTNDGGTTWTASGGTVTGAQLGYNLTIAVHPTDANILLFGEVHLWRSTNSGGSWTRVSTGSPGIHADQHALVFHPTDGNGSSRQRRRRLVLDRRRRHLGAPQQGPRHAAVLRHRRRTGSTRRSCSAARRTTAPSATSAIRHGSTRRSATAPSVRSTARPTSTAGTRPAGTRSPASAATTPARPGSWVAEAVRHHHELELVLPALRDGPERLDRPLLGLRPPLPLERTAATAGRTSRCLAAGSNITAIAGRPRTPASSTSGLRNGRVSGSPERHDVDVDRYQLLRRSRPARSPISPSPDRLEHRLRHDERPDLLGGIGVVRRRPRLPDDRRGHDLDERLDRALAGKPGQLRSSSTPPTRRRSSSAATSASSAPTTVGRAGPSGTRVFPTARSRT